MVYIIFDNSFECDGYDSPSGIIVYISTNKDDAINHFDKYYANPPNSDKWCYQYKLIEYPDRFNACQYQECKVIKESSNDEE